MVRKSVLRGVAGILPLVVALWAVSLGVAQAGLFVDYTPVYPVGKYPAAVVAGDFNGDGKNDLAVANCGSDDVSILIGNGDGTFQAAVNYGAGDRPFSVTSGDFNGDGKIDLAVADNSSSGVSILLGRGNGTFLAAVSYGAAGDPDLVMTADFNGDGKTDLLAHQGFVGGIMIGNGDGTFQPFRFMGEDFIAVTNGDFNGDGKIDLAVSSGGYVGILFGNGDGTFQPEVFIEFGRGAADSITTGDFNGDGIPDLAVGSFYDWEVVVMIGNGDGTFQAGIATQTPAQGLAAQITTGDFNGDGMADLVLGGCKPLILLGNGDGTFQSPVGYGADNYGFKFVAVADFNNDGRMDLVAPSALVDNISILIGNGDGTFQSDPITYTAYSQSTGDFNGDGRIDLVTTTWKGLSILIGKGNGMFQTGFNYDCAVNEGLYRVHTGDFNGDGKIDLVVGLVDEDQLQHYVLILIGNGDGTFQTAGKTAIGYHYFYNLLTTGDFNSDGKSDLAVAYGDYDGGNEKIAILLSNGDGTLQDAVNVAVGVNPESIAVDDFNGDGRLDLVVANTGSENVSILFGNGDGSFEAAFNYSTGAGPSSVATGDFNGDGKSDLIVANSDSDNLSVLLGKGNGTFKAAVHYGAGDFPQSVAVVDFNGDGMSDLVVANRQGSNLSILLGNGEGTFQPAVNYGQYGAMSVSPGDFNGDGHADLAVGSGGGVTVLIHDVPASTPTQLAAKPVSAVAALVGWQDNASNEKKYRILRKQGRCTSREPWVNVGSTLPNLTQYRDNGLLPETNYAYRVAVMNGDGSSDLTGCVQIRTPKAGIPIAPQGLRVVSVAASSSKLTWQEHSPDTSSFRLFRMTGIGTWDLLTTLGGGETSFVDDTATGNSSDNAYSYRVAVVNGAGLSAPSAVAVVPYPPEGLGATPTPGAVVLAWSVKPTRASAFNVFRKEGACASAGTNFTLLTRTSRDQLRHADTTVTPGTTYAYKVRTVYDSPELPVASGLSAFTPCVEVLAE